MIARAFRQAAVLLALALVPALISGTLQLEARGDAPPPLLQGEVRPGTARMWGDSVQWVDARSAAKFERAHVPGAVRLRQEEWEELVPAFLDAWDPEKTIVVYDDSASGDEAHGVAQRLRDELTLDGVWVLKGGWRAWQEK